jgi:hypothetical protein
MKLQKFNWQIWAGFLLTIAAGFSYTLVFVWWPVTRDFPWVNLLLFGMAMVLLFVGVRRAFAPGRGAISKIGSSILAILSVGMLSLFIFGAFIKGAPPKGVVLIFYRGYW